MLKEQSAIISTLAHNTAVQSYKMRLNIEMSLAGTSPLGLSPVVARKTTGRAS